MLKGDVSVTPLADVLADLAAQAATGCLHLDDEAGDEALVYVKNGLVYAAYVPGRRPQLGARLISSGALAPEALAEALEAQETELQGWRLGELLVHLGYVDRDVVEAFVLEQLCESTFDLSRWTSGRFRFRKNEKTREDVGTLATVEDLLAEVDRRRVEWNVISGVVNGPGAVPVLSAGGGATGEMTLDQDQWALLCKVDGDRSIAELARDCGFTTFEAGQIVYSLVGAGLLDVEETVDETYESVSAVDEDLAPLGAALASAFAAVADEEPAAPVVPVVPSQAESFEDDSEVSRLLGSVMPQPPPALDDDVRTDLDSFSAALADLPSLAFPMSLEPEYPVAPAEEPVAAPPPVPAVEDPFGDSLARVSEALSALLGDALPAVSLPEPPPPPEPNAEELEADRLETERRERSRAAAAAELAEAHALAEAARQGRTQPPRINHRAREEAEEAARREAERLAAEEAARVEAERVEADRVEAQRAAAARVAAEQAAAEVARLAAEEAERQEAERQAAERLAAEDAARVEAERIEAERIEAERIEAERIEAERVAAEEAARVEAERAAAAAEAARVEAARVEAARVEAQRLEAEEAARVIAEIAAEQAAAEEAARAEAERVEAARAEAERVAAEAAPVTPPIDNFAVASLLRDLNDVADTVETVEEYVPEEPPTAPEPREPAHASHSRAGLSETAALMRELSSLGLDDEPSTPPPPAAHRAASAAAAVRPVPPKDPKKRKGLFGRG